MMSLKNPEIQSVGEPLASLFCQDFETGASKFFVITKQKERIYFHEDQAALFRSTLPCVGSRDAGSLCVTDPICPIATIQAR